VAVKFDRAEWYVVRLWELYQQHISMAAMAKMTKINYREIQQIINEIKKQLNDNYNAIID
jgi:predicted HTH domain antitoxin